MPEPARKLHLVDPTTGEITEECPECQQWERTYDELQRKYRGALAQIGNLRADKEAEARKHEKWVIGMSVFRYWQSLTGHDRAEWTPDRFWLLEPFLRRAEECSEDGAAKCRSAIRGLVASDYHMRRGKYAHREGPTYDDFWRPFESQDKFESFQSADPQRDAVPTFTQQTLIDHAKEIASRVLERAKLIREENDPVAVTHLLVEVDRLHSEWLAMPMKRDAA